MLILKKKLTWFVILVIVPALAGVVFLFYKPHRNIRTEQATLVSANQIYMEFIQNEAAANKKYLNQPLKVTGVIHQIKMNQQGETVILLQTDDPIYGILCTFQNQSENITSSDTLVVKGFCSGFTGDVVLRDCILVR